MIPRYNRPLIKKIWTLENKFNIWTQIEILIAEKLSDIGAIPKIAAAIFGIAPISDNFSAMRISICVQILNLFSSVQIFFIKGLLYLGIILFFINHLLENQYCFLIK